MMVVLELEWAEQKTRRNHFDVCPNQNAASGEPLNPVNTIIGESKKAFNFPEFNKRKWNGGKCSKAILCFVHKTLQQRSYGIQQTTLGFTMASVFTPLTGLLGGSLIGT